MDVCIDLPGTIDHGLWSPQRGESRWTQNIARLLAEHGHKVTCVAHPGEWGDCPKVPNVLLTKSAQGQSFDLYLDACWWKGKSILIKADVYAHLHFGLEQHCLTEEHMGKNHILVYPFKKNKSNFIIERNPFKDKTFFLPVPMGNKLGSSHFDKTQITFTAKDIFLDRQITEPWWYTCGKSVIETMKLAQDKFGYSCHFFGKDQLHGLGSCAIHDYGIDLILNSISNKTFYQQITYRRARDVIDNTKMSFPVIDIGGSTLDSIILGVLPLMWDGSLFEEQGKKYGWILNHRASPEDIRNNILRGLTDKAFYDSLLADCQEEASVHLDASCIEYFNRIVEWANRNV